MDIVCPGLRECVCARVKTGTLFSVSHMHMSIVHLPPTVCDRRVSVSAHSEFLVHRVGWNGTNKHAVPVKLDLKILTLYEEKKIYISII